MKLCRTLWFLPKLKRSLDCITVHPMINNHSLYRDNYFFLFCISVLHRCPTSTHVHTFSSVLCSVGNGFFSIVITSGGIKSNRTPCSSMYNYRGTDDGEAIGRSTISLPRLESWIVSALWNGCCQCTSESFEFLTQAKPRSSCAWENELVEGRQSNMMMIVRFW